VKAVWLLSESSRLRGSPRFCKIQQTSKSSIDPPNP
jgi:hypothetical protein